jgi:resuscitation-promoting factor RpfB
MALAGGIAGNSSAEAAVPAATAVPAGSAVPARSAASARPAVEPAAVTQPAAAPAARRGPRHIAKAMLARFHWSVARQFPALNKLWNQESGWRVHAYNRHSGARGIPQADPGRKMASAGKDWATSAVTQIRWGLRYIRGRYGSPRRAWRHEVHAGWY